MENKIRRFQDLIICQEGISLVKDIYSLTKKFSKEERYGLTSQMRRSAISIPSNIAEGFKRYHNKEYTQFLHITLGSSAELETQLIISKELNYCTDIELKDITKTITLLSKRIQSLIKKL